MIEAPELIAIGRIINGITLPINAIPLIAALRPFRNLSDINPPTGLPMIAPKNVSDWIAALCSGVNPFSLKRIGRTNARQYTFQQYKKIGTINVQKEPLLIISLVFL